MTESPFGPQPSPLTRPISGHLSGPTIELRRFTSDDAMTLSELVASNLNHLRPFMPWASGEMGRSPDDYGALISAWNDEMASGMSAFLAIIRREEMIGSAGLHRRRPDQASLEIGYWVAEHVTRQGVATQATLLLAEEAFAHHEIDRVELYCDKSNRASAAVARKAGFRFVGSQPDPLHALGITAPGQSGVEICSVLSRAAFNHAWRSKV